MACERAVAATHAILKRTLRHALGKPTNKAESWGRELITCAHLDLDLSGGKKPTVEQMELRLVQSKRDIENPPSLTSS